MRPWTLACLLAVSLTTITSHSLAADKPVLGAWGVETQNFSTAVRPGNDFYRYVNEGWLRTAAPPPGLPYANAFIDAYVRTQGQLQVLIDGILASPPAPGSDEARIAGLYRSYVDYDRRNALGLTPAVPYLAAIAAIATQEDLARLAAKPFYKAPIDVGVVIDDRDPQRYVVSLRQSGLGLPGRDYYLAPGEPFAGHRAAYLAHITDVFRRAGIEDDPAKARAILELENRLAEAHWTPTEMRDPVKGYRAMSLNELEAYAPGFAWGAFFAESGLGRPGKIVLQADTAVRASAAIVAATDLDTLKAYLSFHLVDDLSPVLSADWEAANFAFYGKRLSGLSQQQSTPNRAKEFLARNYGEILGRAYTKTYFPPAYRDQMNSMIANLRAAFRRRLEENTWMDAPTRQAAIVKLDAITSHIGYPDRWRDWSAVSFDPSDLVGNKRAIAAFEMADAVGKLSEPRRDWQWEYAASEINAGYSPSMNSITFPAGILQSPFFDPAADPAVNYGSIGAVIGHELGHAFDDQGSQSDEKGALRNWWTDGARAEFNKRTALLVEQFNGYSPLPGMFVNGGLTLGENIGDLGGLSVAFEAYRMFVDQEQGGRAPVIDGFTGDQRYFLAWGQLWRDVTTPDQARQNLLTDVHSPGEFRANGPLRNLNAWYTAFGVKEGDALYLPPGKRAVIW